MNAKERYNRIVDRIENLVRDDSYPKPSDIAEMLCREEGCTARDLSSVCSFLTGQPLNQYIRERKMMAAYQSLLESPHFAPNDVISISGYGDQPAFTKAFKQRFQMTPKAAYRAKDWELCLPAMTWEVISEAQVPSEKAKEVETVDAKTVFGISSEQLERITQAMEYQALYGFTQAQSDAAYELAEEIDCPLKECFEYVDNFCVHYLADDKGDIQFDDAKLKKQVLKSAPVAEFCINFDLSIEEGYELMEELLSVGLSPGQVDPEIVRLYLNGQLPIRHFWYAFNWGLEHGIELQEMEEFLLSASAYHTLEEAKDMMIKNILDEADRDPYLGADPGDEEECQTGYELETQETDFSQCERFEDEEDIDNLGYDDTDNLDF